MTPTSRVALIPARALQDLAQRVAVLGGHLQDGDERSWLEYRESVGLRARLAEHLGTAWSSEERPR